MVSDSLTIATADDVKVALRREFRGDEESYIFLPALQGGESDSCRYRRLDELTLDEVVFDLVKEL